jgi:hypothetical protein
MGRQGQPVRKPLLEGIPRSAAGSRSGQKLSARRAAVMSARSGSGRSTLGRVGGPSLPGNPPHNAHFPTPAGIEVEAVGTSQRKRGVNDPLRLPLLFRGNPVVGDGLLLSRRQRTTTAHYTAWGSHPESTSRRRTSLEPIPTTSPKTPRTTHRSAARTPRPCCRIGFTFPCPGSRTLNAVGVKLRYAG